MFIYWSLRRLQRILHLFVTVSPYNRHLLPAGCFWMKGWMIMEVVRHFLSEKDKSIFVVLKTLLKRILLFYFLCDGIFLLYLNTYKFVFVISLYCLTLVYTHTSKPFFWHLIFIFTISYSRCVVFHFRQIYLGNLRKMCFYHMTRFLAYIKRQWKYICSSYFLMEVIKPNSVPRRVRLHLPKMIVVKA